MGNYKTYVFYYNTPLTENQQFLNSEEVISHEVNRYDIQNIKLTGTETAQQIHEFVQNSEKALTPYFIIEKDNTIKHKDTYLEENEYINTDFNNISYAISVTRGKPEIINECLANDEWGILRAQ
jgi:hypothetical protein